MRLVIILQIYRVSHRCLIQTSHATCEGESYLNGPWCVPSLQHQGKSNARLHHFVESPRKQPSFARSESFSARSDARSAYSLIKTKSSSSLIFADLSYPTGGADE